MTNQNYHQRLEKIVNIMLEMTKIDDYDRLLNKLMEGALNLTTNTKVSIMLLNHLTGELETIRESIPIPDNKTRNLRSDLGITGLALQKEEPIRADDILQYKWRNIYVEHWDDTRSEIALPLVIDGVTVQIKTQLKKSASKTLGVLNIESPEVGSFSREDEAQLWLLARHAAILLDKCDYDTKINQLRNIERSIAEEKKYEKIMQFIVRSITDTIKFKLVNISLIEGNYIKTKYIAGIPKNLKKDFKKMATHSLDSDDIQADIVRQRKIEVLDSNDPRLDPNIFEKFGHDSIIRVFIPMIEQSTNRVLGTIEAGYPKEYRKYIYEQDIEILKNFVNYATQTLERRKTDIIDRITHEFRSPIVGIQSHASFMQRRFYDLPDDLIEKKFNDIITDCGILFNQIGRLDYFLRGIDRQNIRIERTLIFRDIIIKTVNQLRPTIRSKGFSIYDIEYPDNCNRIAIFTDKAKINQVVYNLLINSIKYAIKDPNQFHIKLEIEDKPKELCIKFMDWGTGIENDDRNRIFEAGFRAQEAIRNDVVGSGLGLAIARNIMSQFGGDLLLTNLRKPTEFQMILPKKTKEEIENDLIY